MSPPVQRSLLQLIDEETESLGRAERRIADVVQARPDDVIQMSMATLAEAAEVSDPTIVRFCRRFGFNGYAEFKIRLGQSLVPAAPFHYETITTQDSVENVVRKTCRNTMSAIQRVMNEIDPAVVDSAASQIRDAAWTGIYSAGMSEVTAMDAEHKFQRLGIRCAAISGRSKQLSQVRFVGPGETVFVLSESGATRQLVTVAEQARERDAVVVSVTEPISRLAEVSSTVIGISRYHHTEVFTPLASRLMHHLVVNMLSASIAIANGNEYPDQLPALDSWKTDKIQPD